MQARAQCPTSLGFAALALKSRMEEPDGFANPNLAASAARAVLPTIIVRVEKDWHNYARRAAAATHGTATTATTKYPLNMRVNIVLALFSVASVKPPRTLYYKF